GDDPFDAHGDATSSELVDLLVRADAHDDVGERVCLAQQDETGALLRFGQEYLPALVDAAFEQTRRAHAARSHPAAELEIDAALERVVEDRCATVGRVEEAALGPLPHLDPVPSVGRTRLEGLLHRPALLRRACLAVV